MSSVHVENELDRHVCSSRQVELANITAEAAQLRDTETSIDKALTKLQRFATTLNNLAVEVFYSPYHHNTCKLRLTQQSLPPTKEHVFARVCLFVCLFVCLLARLLKNACMDLDEMLRVDRCRDMDELINF